MCPTKRLYNEDKATAKLYVQKAAQAADEAWQQTVGDLQGPRVANPIVSALEHRNSASQDEDSEDMDFSAPRKSRLSAPQLQAQLSRLTHRTRLRRLKSTLLSKGAWHYENRRLVPHAPQVALSLQRVCGKCPDPARLRHQRADKTWKQSVDRIWRAPPVQLLLGPTAGTRRNLQHHRSYARTPRMRSRCCLRLETCRPGHHYGTQTASQSKPADILTTAAVTGRGAALDVCVASSIAAARGDAAQASFDRKLSHYRNEIVERRQQGIHYRPLVWTADGRPHPAATRTLQDAADIAASRNGEQMSAKSLQRRWKHEIQIALLCPRAAMTRAVLPNPSARAEWLPAGIIDRALHHWCHVTPPSGRWTWRPRPC